MAEQKTGTGNQGNPGNLAGERNRQGQGRQSGDVPQQPGQSRGADMGRQEKSQPTSGGQNRQQQGRQGGQTSSGSRQDQSDFNEGQGEQGGQSQGR